MQRRLGYYRGGTIAVSYRTRDGMPRGLVSLQDR